MANMHLVTGYAGQEHVTAADHGAFHSYLFGVDQFVFDRGNKLAANIESNNQIRVLDGDIYIHGRHVRLNEGTYVDLAIDNGEQGMLRNDLIVARYTKDSSTAVEEVNLVVIKGTSASSNPVDPEYTDGNILEGALLHDMPLYRVPLNGLNVGELVPLFTVKEAKTIQDKQDRTNDLAEESALADADAFPFFDASANAHRKTLWSNIKRFFAAAKHEHDADDITSGILPVLRGGTGVDSIAELAASMGVARMETGSYEGANSTSKTLTFGFEPKMVIVRRDDTPGYSGDNSSFGLYAFYGMTSAVVREIHTNGTAGAYGATLTWNGNTLSWSDSQKCLGASGVTYYYMAIG